MKSIFVKFLLMLIFFSLLSSEGENSNNDLIYNRINENIINQEEI